MLVDESDMMRRHVRAAASPFFFMAANARKLSLSGSLGWAEGALKCHPRNSDSRAAIEVLSVSSVFRVYPSVLVQFGRSSWFEKLGSRQPYDAFEAPPLSYGL